MLIYKNGVKNGVSTLLLFDKNGVPQHSLFDVKSENGVKKWKKEAIEAWQRITSEEKPKMLE